MKCVVIGPDRDLTSQLFDCFEEVGDIDVKRDFAFYPLTADLLRLIRSLAPQFLFISLQDQPRAIEIIETLQAKHPALQVAVFHSSMDSQALLTLMQHGIREFLAAPFGLTAMVEAVTRMRDASYKNPLVTASTNLVYSFLPSKPGSGTTTLAVNTALCMARQPDTNGLLMDLDLNSGLIRFLLKLDNNYTILDAADHAHDMDEVLWPQLVCSLGQLDVLHTAKITPGERLEPSQIRNLIEFARKNYKTICVDLSGSMEKFAIEVMQESKSIFLVCTPEIPSLHLAREKFQFLTEAGLSDKVEFLLNRNGKEDLLQAEQIQSLLGERVALSFPNDYRGVSNAVAEGKEVNPRSELGKQITNFSNILLQRPMELTTNSTSTKKIVDGIGELFKFGSSRGSGVSNSENKA